MHVHRYEQAFMRIAFIVLVVFALAVAISALGLGVTLPGFVEQIDPQAVLDDPGFANPGVREVFPGRYVAYFVVEAWQFRPTSITVPAGAEVTFFLTSRDVIHGFKVFDTNVNIMVIPGQISEVTYTFDQPGTYQFYCHEYCGSGHHLMTGTITVVEAPQVSASE